MLQWLNYSIEIYQIKNDASSKYYKSLFRWLEDAKLLIPSSISGLFLLFFIVLILSLVFVLLLRQR
jgi:hypothetical protein